MSKAGSVDFSIPGGFCYPKWNWNPCLNGDKEKLKLFDQTIIYTEDPGVSCAAHTANALLCLYFSAFCGINYCALKYETRHEGPADVFYRFNTSVPGYIFSLATNEAGETSVNCAIHNKGCCDGGLVIRFSNVVEVRMVEASRYFVETYTKGGGEHSKAVIIPQHTNIYWALQIIYVNSRRGCLEHFITQKFPFKTRQEYNTQLVSTPGILFGSYNSVGYTTPIALPGTPYDNLVIAINQMIKNKVVSGTGLITTGGREMAIYDAIYDTPGLRNRAFDFNPGHRTLVRTVNYPIYVSGQRQEFVPVPSHLLRPTQSQPTGVQMQNMIPPVVASPQSLEFAYVQDYNPSAPPVAVATQDISFTVTEATVIAVYLDDDPSMANSSQPMRYERVPQGQQMEKR